MATYALGDVYLDANYRSVAVEVRYSPVGWPTNTGRNLTWTLWWKKHTDPSYTLVHMKDAHTGDTGQNLWHDTAYDPYFSSGSGPTGSPNGQWAWDGGTGASGYTASWHYGADTQSADNSGMGFYASVFPLVPNTAYDIKVQVTDGTIVTTFDTTNGADSYYANRTAVSTGTSSTGAITTKQDGYVGAGTTNPVLDPASLVPTHYVNATTGSDTNAGTSSGAAWQSLAHAIAQANSATGDMVIQFASGFYQIPNYNTSANILVGNGHRITLVAATPAVTTDSQHNRTLRTPGTAAVIHQGTTWTSSPGGSAWTLTNVTGHNGSYNCYKASFPTTGSNWAATTWGINQVTVARDSGHTGHRLIMWKYFAGAWTNPTDSRTWEVDGPAYATEVIAVNGIHNYGFTSWIAGSSPTSTTANKNGAAGGADNVGQDVYLIMPQLPRASDNTLSSNPNDFYVEVGYESQAAGYGYGQLILNGPNLRVCGFETRLINIVTTTSATNAVIDHNYVCHGFVSDQATAGAIWADPTTRAADVLIENNWCQHTGVNHDHVLGSTEYYTGMDAGGYNWLLPKDIGTLYMPNSGGGWTQASSSWAEMGAQGEVGGIKPWGGSWRGTYRYNTVAGGFDGLTNDNALNYDRYGYYAHDWHDSLVSDCTDNCIEATGRTINNKVWNIRCQYSLNAIVTAYSYMGPTYYYRIQGFKIGEDWGFEPAGSGIASQGGDYVVKSGDYIQCQPHMVYFVHHSYWTDGNYVTSGGYAAEVSGTGVQSSPNVPTSTQIQSPTTRFVYRNCIHRLMGTIWGPVGPTPVYGWDEQYNTWCTTVGNATYQGTNPYGFAASAGFEGYNPAGVTSWGGVVFSTITAYTGQTGGGPGQTGYRQNTGTSGAAIGDGTYASTTTINAVDGLFSSPTTGNLALKSGSLAVDAGVAMDTTYGASGVDLMGVAYYGSGPDIGAIEYSTSPSVTDSATVSESVSLTAATAASDALTLGETSGLNDANVTGSDATTLGDVRLLIVKTSSGSGASGFENWRSGAPFGGLSGTTDNQGFEIWRAGSPDHFLTAGPTTTVSDAAYDADAAALSESVTASAAVAGADAVVLAEVVAISAANAASDAATLGESASATQPVSSSDAATLSETAVVGLGVAASDTFVMAETPGFNVAGSDSLALAETTHLSANLHVTGRQVTVALSTARSATVTANTGRAATVTLDTERSVTVPVT